MRTVHRILSLFVVLLTLYLSLTGTLIQAVDLRSIHTHAPATDPDMMAMREDSNGPGVYALLTPQDFAAATLPIGFDYQGAVSQLLLAARSSLGAQVALDYAEIRMESGVPVGKTQSGSRVLTYEFASGRSLLTTPPRGEQRPLSLRNEFKTLHRMTAFRKDWLLFINPIVGIGLSILVVTGVWMYVQLLRARSRIGRRNWFWKAGGWWRTLHRWISLMTAVFLLVIALSGTWLAYESLVFGYYMTAHLPTPGKPQPMPASPLTPLGDARVPAMMNTTLDSWHRLLPEEPLKVVRLRIYGGMPQGAVILGTGDDTHQIVFNATTGREVSETEPGYPETGFPFGWQAHQYAKQIHRGLFIGLPGRWMGFLSGLSLIYLSISGAWMYYKMWQRRRKSGRAAIIWS